MKVCSVSKISKGQGKNISIGLMRKSDQDGELVWGGTNNPCIGGGMPFNFCLIPVTLGIISKPFDFVGEDVTLFNFGINPILSSYEM